MLTVATSLGAMVLNLKCAELCGRTTSYTAYYFVSSSVCVLEHHVTDSTWSLKRANVAVLLMSPSSTSWSTKLRQCLHRLGHTQELTHREAEVLHHLYAQRNQVFERRAVLQALWGDDTFFNGRSLDVYITRLRRYLTADEQVQIVNVRGIGYKLML